MRKNLSVRITEVAFLLNVLISAVAQQLTEIPISILGLRYRPRTFGSRASLVSPRELPANKELDLIVQEFQGHPEGLQVRWEIHWKSENWQEAREVAARLVSAKPERVRNWVQESRSLSKLNQLESAKLKFRQARESRDWPVDDLHELASVAADLGDYEEASACIRAASEKPGFAELRKLVLVTGLFKKIHPEIEALGP
jgi:tetratricopeptide (TPR) repeat protein